MNGTVSTFDELPEIIFEQSWIIHRNEIYAYINKLGKESSELHGLTREQLIDRVSTLIEDNLQKREDLNAHSRIQIQKVLLKDLFGFGSFDLFLHLNFPVDAWTSSEDLWVYFVNPLAVNQIRSIYKYPIPYPDKNALLLAMERLAFELKTRFSEGSPVFLCPWDEMHTIEMVRYPAAIDMRLRIRPSDIEL